MSLRDELIATASKVLGSFETTGNQPKWFLDGAAREMLDAIVARLDNPPEEMWDGLPRAMMMWNDFGSGEKTPRNLFRHLERSGYDVPQWLRDEPEMKALDHVPSKGTRAVILFRAMLSAIRPKDEGE